MEIIEELHLRVLSFVITRPTREIAITVTKQNYTKQQNKRERKLLQYKNRQNPKREKFTRQSKCKLMSKITILKTKKGIEFCTDFNTPFVFQVLKALVTTLLLNLYEISV